MKLKAGLIALAAVGVVSFAGTQVADAATWHKGIPKSVKGYWKAHTGGKKIKSGYYYNNYVYTSFSGTTISTMLKEVTHQNGKNFPQFDSGSPFFYHVKYHYLGNHVYKFKGTYALGGGTGVMTVKVSKHKLLMNDNHKKTLLKKISHATYKKELYPLFK